MGDATLRRRSRLRHFQTRFAVIKLRAPVGERDTEDAERDEYEAMREGLCDLVRLLRYEQRAWSRRKRAVCAFMAIKLANQ